MELTDLLARFIEAQNNQDSKAYVDCFTDSAIVHDEGKTHNGKEKIRQWIEDANKKYNSFMKPLNFEEDGIEVLLTAEVSGTFPGSPAILSFHIGLKNGLINSLEIKG
jgi:ketosteroid isomerase-like protein